MPCTHVDDSYLELLLRPENALEVPLSPSNNFDASDGMVPR
jgi:hypothetical protein